jgi:hypothetical protein
VTTAHAALQPRYIDLIRDGVPGWQIRRKGRDVAIYNGLYRTALAAVNAGWPFAEWTYLLRSRGSVLGNQAATKRNGEDRPQAAVDKQLRIIWDRASTQARRSPTFTEADRRSYVAGVRTWLSDPDCPAPENQRRVLDAIARRAAELNVTSPACPRSYLLAETGLGLTALRTALAQLIESGLLVQVQKGRRGTKESPSSGVAAVYRLPRPEVLPPARRSTTPTSAAIAASSAPGLCPHWLIVPPCHL